MFKYLKHLMIIVLSVSFLSFSNTHSKGRSIQENHPGKAVYTKVCLVCHKADGSGMTGVFPPITNTEWVKENDERLIKIVLHGMKGEITVNGKKYNSVMPANTQLTDQQIADVINYIRTEFNDMEGKITPEDVKKLR